MSDLRIREMRTAITLLILFSSLILTAQNKTGGITTEFDSKKAIMHKPNLMITATDVNRPEFINTYITTILNPGIYGDFVLKHTTRSIGGEHLLYQQYFNGKKVYRGSVKINIDNNNKIKTVFTFAYNLNNVAGNKTAIVVDPAQYLNIRYGSTPFPIKYKLEEVYFVLNNVVRSGTLLTYSSRQSAIGDKEILFDENGSVVFENDQMSYHHNHLAGDTTVKTKVFNPDPLTTAGVVYGTPYKDYSDADSAVLNNQRIDTSMTVTFQNDTFYLSNQFCVVGEFDLPVKPICNGVGLSQMYYTRSNDCFEQTNVFYHLTTYKKYMENLGFIDLMADTLFVDAQGWSGQDNSSFSPSENLLSFGEGGVDDAEDADVVLHEYQHAIAFSAAPGTNTGNERKALDEANGDYIAASYSRNISEHDWDKVFTWDGHNQFWAGRNAISSKHYPDDLSGTSFYNNTDIWAATLMQIWEDIGMEKTDKLTLESIHSYSAGMSMQNAAELIVYADSMIYGGQHYNAIMRRFCDRGLISTAACNSIPNGIADKSEEGIQIRGNHPGSNTIQVLSGGLYHHYKINSLEGKELFSGSLDKTGTIDLSTLQSGMYFVTVTGESATQSIKVVR